MFYTTSAAAAAAAAVSDDALRHYTTDARELWPSPVRNEDEADCLMRYSRDRA